MFRHDSENRAGAWTAGFEICGHPSDLYSEKVLLDLVEFTTSAIQICVDGHATKEQLTHRYDVNPQSMQLVRLLRWRSGWLEK